MSVSVKFAFFPRPFFKCHTVTLFLSFFTLLCCHFCHACHQKGNFLLPSYLGSSLTPSPSEVTAKLAPPFLHSYSFYSLYYSRYMVDNTPLKGKGEALWPKSYDSKKILVPFPLIDMLTYLVHLSRSSLSFISKYLVLLHLFATRRIRLSFYVYLVCHLILAVKGKFSFGFNVE